MSVLIKMETSPCSGIIKWGCVVAIEQLTEWRWPRLSQLLLLGSNPAAAIARVSNYMLLYVCCEWPKTFAVVIQM